jgi:hypothetical protein
MRISDPSFSSHDGLKIALELLAPRSRDAVDLPLTLPATGLGDIQALEILAVISLLPTNSPLAEQETSLTLSYSTRCSNRKSINAQTMLSAASASAHAIRLRQGNHADRISSSRLATHWGCGSSDPHA